MIFEIGVTKRIDRDRGFTVYSTGISLSTELSVTSEQNTMLLDRHVWDYLEQTLNRELTGTLQEQLNVLKHFLLSKVKLKDFEYLNGILNNVCGSVPVIKVIREEQ